MAAHREVVDRLGQTLAAAARCASSETVETYAELNEELQELDAAARRSWEGEVDCHALVGRLRAGDPLDAEAMALLRLMIVGDADSYLKYDQEFERCKDDLAKILAEIDRLKEQEIDRDGLMRLRVLCQEACSLLRPAERHLEQRDRIRSFEAATRGGIDEETGRALAGIIDDALSR